MPPVGFWRRRAAAPSLKVTRMSDARRLLLFPSLPSSGAQAIAAVMTDVGKLESVLNEAGKTLLYEIGGAEADPTVIKCLGPIRSRIWKFKPDRFAGKLTAELWDVA